MVGIVIVSHSHLIAEGVGAARARDGWSRRPARDRRRPGHARPPDRHRRRAGDGGDRARVVRRRCAGADGPGQRGAVRRDGARPAARGTPAARAAVRGADRRGRGVGGRHGEAGRVARSRGAGGARRARRQDRAPGRRRTRRGCGAPSDAPTRRRALDPVDGDRASRAARPAGRALRPDGVVVRRQRHGPRPDERPRPGGCRQPERRRDAQRHAGTRDRGHGERTASGRGVGRDR